VNEVATHPPYLPDDAMNKTFAILLLSLPLLAQSPLRLTRHATLPPIHAGTAMAVGDFDSDGDLDVVIGNGALPNQLLENNGYGGFVDVTAGRLPNAGTNATSSIHTADIDGDGDLDILVGNDDDLPNRVLRNNGTGVFTDVSQTHLPTNAESTQNQIVADLDNDGDVDWFTVDLSGCRVYENLGTGVFVAGGVWRTQNVPVGLGDARQMANAADVDGDSDLDILVPNVLGMPTLLENQGGAFGPFPTPLPFVVGSFLYNKFVDLDGDGDQDLLLDRTRVLLQNQGNGTFVNVTGTSFPAVHAQTTAILDVDGDGDIDLVSPSVYWRNDGTGHFSGTAIPATTFPSLLAFYAADFDGDGDQDAPPRMNFARQVDAPSPPVLGSLYSVDFHFRTGAPSVVIALGSLGAMQVPIPPLGILHLEQSTMVTLSAQLATTSPLRLSWTLPNVPAFAGVTLYYQAYVEDPVVGGYLTNGIADVVQ